MVRAGAPKSICQAVGDSSSTRWRARAALSTMMALFAQVTPPASAQCRAGCFPATRVR